MTSKNMLMKRQFYLLGLLLVLFGASSCKKDDPDPEPLPLAVGDWTLEYGILSDFPAAMQANGVKIDPASEIMWGNVFYGSRISILNENKAFLEVYKAGGFVADLDGTWVFENSKLTLKYTDTTIPNGVYTYRITKGVEELVTELESLKLADGDGVERDGKIQYVYRRH